MNTENQHPIKAIIGLGNPGPRFVFHRHNIGFRVVDVLCDRFFGTWHEQGDLLVADIQIDGTRIILIKPQTFMNLSGKAIAYLKKKGIDTENILVIHDELEKPFGSLAFSFGGSARGHNGLRSVIASGGKDFARLRFGIGRPERKEMVGDYVLQNFQEDPAEVDRLVDQAADMIEEMIKG